MPEEVTVAGSIGATAPAEPAAVEGGGDGASAPAPQSEATGGDPAAAEAPVANEAEPQAAPEPPEPGEAPNAEELVDIINRQRAELDVYKRHFGQQPGKREEQPEPSAPRRFEKMTPDDFAKALDKSPYDAVAGIVEETFTHDGIGAALIEEVTKAAEKRLEAKWGPAFGKLFPVTARSEIQSLEEEFGADVVRPLSKDVQATMQKTGVDARTAFTFLFGQQSLARAKGGKAAPAPSPTQTAAEAASRATQGQPRPAQSQHPPSQVDKFLGTTQKKKFRLS